MLKPSSAWPMGDRCISCIKMSRDPLSEDRAWNSTDSGNRDGCRRESCCWPSWRPSSSRCWLISKGPRASAEDLVELVCNRVTEFLERVADRLGLRRVGHAFKTGVE